MRRFQSSLFSSLLISQQFRAFFGLFSVETHNHMTVAVAAEIVPNARIFYFSLSPVERVHRVLAVTAFLSAYNSFFFESAVRILSETMSVSLYDILTFFEI